MGGVSHTRVRRTRKKRSGGLLELKRKWVRGSSELPKLRKKWASYALPPRKRALTLYGRGNEQAMLLDASIAK